MSKQRYDSTRAWYAIHTYSGYEEKVAESIQQRVESVDMADKILKGTPVSEVPAVALTDYQYVINSKTASTLGIKTPTGGNYQFIGA